MSKQDQANFRGGPMPAGYAAEAQKRQAEAQKRMPSSYKAWQEQHNAALSKRGATPGNNPAPANPAAP